MKIKNLFILSAFILLLGSCVVKSLNPFYTKETIFFDDRFIGEWKDEDNGNWKVIKFTNLLFAEEGATFDALFKSNKVDNNYNLKNLSKEDLKLYKKYTNSYYVLRTYKNQEVTFLVTPFKINNQYFLDFLPFDDLHNSKINGLLKSHMVYAHSLVKYDVINNGKIAIKWLDEEKLEQLFKEKKIKIKHKKTGISDDKFLLTASSKELQKFIEKYIASNDTKKWDTSTKFTLTRVNVTK